MAMMILVVAVLGTIVLIEGGMRSTSRTVAREQGTSLARDLVERTRQVDYAQTAMNAAPNALRAVLGAGEVSALSGTSFTVKRRNIVYSVDIYACSIDDPTDGAGVGDSKFCPACPNGAPTPCDASSPGPGGPVGTPVPAAAVNVLGVEVALGGSLVGTVCTALGNPALFATLSNAASTLAPVSVCPEGAGRVNVNFDPQPDDLRRIRIRVTWETRGAQESLTQTTLVPNPYA